MNVLSLFDGMSCGHLALDRAGIRVDNYYASEIDKYARTVTQANYPETIQVGDVKSVDPWSLPEIDLLIGGSPCQGFSFAGKGLAFNDPRSELFFEYVRLLETTQPRWFLLENVNMKEASVAVISKALNGIQPLRINSRLVSGQLRDRLYWTNIPQTGPPPDQGVSFQSILEDGEARIPKAYTLTATYHKKGAEATRQRNFDKSQRPISWLSPTTSRWLTPLECERLQTVPENYTDHVSNTQRYKMLGNGWTVDVIAHLLKGITNAH